MRNRDFLNQLGLSAIELLVTMVIVGALMTTALPNYRSFKQRAYDAAALSDYRNIKTELYALIARDGVTGNFNMRNLRGPRALRAPLQGARIGDGVRLVQAQRVVRPPTRRLPEREIFRVYVEHLKGGVQYRFTSINGDVLDQVVAR